MNAEPWNGTLFGGRARATSQTFVEPSSTVRTVSTAYKGGDRSSGVERVRFGGVGHHDDRFVGPGADLQGRVEQRQRHVGGVQS